VLGGQGRILEGRRSDLTCLRFADVAHVPRRHTGPELTRGDGLPDADKGSRRHHRSFAHFGTIHDLCTLPDQTSILQYASVQNRTSIDYNVFANQSGQLLRILSAVYHDSVANGCAFANCNVAFVT
jgi:hypothetical protein